MQNNCNLCPNLCNADRTSNVGACGVNDQVKIAKYYLHPYEEPCISGTNGSGTIFFCGCSLKCVFCQNYDVSRNLTGKTLTDAQLAGVFKELEEKGACNINLVTPTHYVDNIINALNIYRPKIPIVYNSHGYETLKTLEKLDPYVDVYLPDLKYFSPKTSLRYCGKSNYFEVASQAVEFMMNKKNTVFDKNGMLESGVIVRHLILPLNTDDSINILKWLNSKVKNGAYVSLMSQYTPFGNVKDYPELNRRITKREYQKVEEFLFSCENLKNYLLQDRSSAETTFIPTWDF